MEQLDEEVTRFEQCMAGVASEFLERLAVCTTVMEFIGLIWERRDGLEGCGGCVESLKAKTLNP